MAKKTKIEKETRRLIEGISDLIKKKGDRYKFKTKSKKDIKKIKRQCPHWVIRKGKERPATFIDPTNPSNWKCAICGQSFPIMPARIEKDDDGNVYNEYIDSAEKTLRLVNQIQFWSVKLGGDATDTKMFLRLRNDLVRFEKVSRQVVKQVNKRQAMDRNKEKTDVMSQFNAYAGFNYKAM